MVSSVMAQTDISATLYGEKGTIAFDNRWFMPVPAKLITQEGNTIPINEKSEGNGYNYEAAELIRCLEKGKTQSEMMSREFSLLLIDTLDAIRREIGLVYPGHDDAVIK